MAKNNSFSLIFIIILLLFSLKSPSENLPENISGITVGKFYGIFIGVENYKYFQKLRTPANDIAALKKIVTAKYGFLQENITELINNKFTLQNIKNSLAQLKEKINENDTLLIFYSGHAFQDEFKETYWIPATSKQKNEAEYFPHGLLIQMLRQIPARHILIVTDTIFSEHLTENSPVVYKKINELNDFNSLYSKKSRKILLADVENKSLSGDVNNQPLSPFMTLFTTYLKQLKKQLYFSTSQLSMDLHRYLTEKSKGSLRLKILKATDDDSGDLFFINTRYMMKEEVKDEPKDEILVELEKVKEFEKEAFSEQEIANEKARKRQLNNPPPPPPATPVPTPYLQITHENEQQKPANDSTQSIPYEGSISSTTTSQQNNLPADSNNNTSTDSPNEMPDSSPTPVNNVVPVSPRDFIFFLLTNKLLWTLLFLVLASYLIYLHLRKKKEEKEEEPEILYLNEYSKRIKEFEQNEFVDVRKIPQDLTSAKWCSYCQKLLSKHKTICENCTSSLFLHNFTAQFIREFEKCPKGFCYVPAGFFYMGSDLAENEKPVHEVYLSSFYISKFLVTNKDYKKFTTSSKHKEGGLFNTVFGTNNQPVVEVTWNDAMKYCQWHGYNLPSEAQWEKAARGWNQKKYPWGNQEPNENYTNFNNKFGHTTEVDKFPQGASVYGIFDLVGNTWEWGLDLFDGGYYKKSPKKNPVNTNVSQYRVIRGGSWFDAACDLRASGRGYANPTYKNNKLSFRCVINVM